MLLPRKQRDYVQLSGTQGLADAFSDHGIHTNLSFFRICSSRPLCDGEDFVFQDPVQLEISMTSRWSTRYGDSFLR